MAQPPPLHDVCVVGSGFAGTFLALRLAERGISTLMVEAGPALSAADAPDGATGMFPHRVCGTAGFPIDFNRSVALGGTSRKWSGVVSRLFPSDFRAQTEFSLFTDWPLSYADLESHYSAAEDLLSAQGGPYRPGCEPPRDAAYRRLVAPGDDRLAALPEGVKLGFYPLAFSLRQPEGPPRLEAVELVALRRAAGATILADRPATRIVTAADGRVSHLEVRAPAGEVERVRARRYVIAAGVFETARLLLLAAAENPGADRRSRPLGRFFHAHPRLRVRVPRCHDRLRLERVWRSHAWGDALRREGTGAICADLNFWSGDVAVDLTLETEPAARNRITLAPERRDAWGRPLAVLHYDWTAVDRRTLARAAEVQAALVALVAGPGFVPGAADLTWFHPAGGCRMARQASDGVVDSDCRVFGMDNLYVAGAAVFPASGSGNPTLTVVALALRLADHLAGELRGSA